MTILLNVESAGRRVALAQTTVSVLDGGDRVLHKGDPIYPDQGPDATPWDKVRMVDVVVLARDWLESTKPKRLGLLRLLTDQQVPHLSDRH